MKYTLTEKENGIEITKTVNDKNITLGEYPYNSSVYGPLCEIAEDFVPGTIVDSSKTINIIEFHLRESTGTYIVILPTRGVATWVTSGGMPNN